MCQSVRGCPSCRHNLPRQHDLTGARRPAWDLSTAMCFYHLSSLGIKGPGCCVASRACPFACFSVRSSVGGAGLGHTGLTVKRGARTLQLTFKDPKRVIAHASKKTLQLTGYAKDKQTGLNICFSASVHVC